MGPVFYLVQCEEARCLISVVLLGNWPHEFALPPLGGGGRAVATSRGWRQVLSEAAEGWGRRFLGRF